MIDVVFDDIDYLFGDVGDNFICSGGYRYSWLNVAYGVWVPSKATHTMLELLRTGLLKYRISRKSCPDVCERLAIVKYPPAVCK